MQITIAVIGESSSGGYRFECRECDEQHTDPKHDRLYFPHWLRSMLKDLNMSITAFRFRIDKSATGVHHWITPGPGQTRPHELHCKIVADALGVSENVVRFCAGRPLRPDEQDLTNYAQDAARLVQQMPAAEQQKAVAILRILAKAA